MESNNNNTNIIETEFIFEENGTFCKIGSGDAGLLEVDLQSMKQKGKEERYISFTVTGLDTNNEVTKAEMLLQNKECFEKFKVFISKLNWND